MPIYGFLVRICLGHFRHFESEWRYVEYCTFGSSFECELHLHGGYRTIIQCGYGYLELGLSHKIGEGIPWMEYKCQWHR